MWIGEQIDAYGIGNGISLLDHGGHHCANARCGRATVASGLRARHPPGNGNAASTALSCWRLMFVVVVIWVVAITEGQRRIPIQSAKHVRGRRVMGGQRQSLPLRVNQAGVMPIVFASSILVFPMFFFRQINVLLKPESWLYPADVRAGRCVQLRSRLHLQHLLHPVDLLVLLLLGGRHVQSEGYFRKPQRLRQLYPRLSAGRANGPVPRAGDDPHHVLGRRLPRHGRRHSNAGRATGWIFRTWSPASTAARGC